MVKEGMLWKYLLSISMLNFEFEEGGWGFLLCQGWQKTFWWLKVGNGIPPWWELDGLKKDLALSGVLPLRGTQAVVDESNAVNNISFAYFYKNWLELKSKRLGWDWVYDWNCF